MPILLRAQVWKPLAPTAIVLQLICILAWPFLPTAQIYLTIVILALGVVALSGILVQKALLEVDEETIDSAKGRMELLEREVRRHRDALDALADGLDIMVFLVDRTGQIIYANAKVVETFRFEDPVGQPLLAVTFSKEIVDLVQASLRTNTVQRAEITFPHPEEHVGIVQAWVNLTAPDRAFVSIYNVTDLRRLERVRRDFVANVSHELRTPMATIRAMAETLQDEVEPNEALEARYLDKIVREVDRLTSITDDLLSLTSAESQVSIKNTLNVSDIANAVCHQLQPKAAAKGLSLRAICEQPCILTASENQLTQVILNLVDNAINYTTSGGVTVITEDIGDTVRIRVEDTGIGIASEHVGRIFERFYRVDKGRSRASGGTGLGLSIVRNMVEGHGGKVSVESDLNHGTVFTVHLPKDEIRNE